MIPRSSISECSYSLSNRWGPFLFTYALYPHEGSWQDVSLNRWAAAVNGGYMVTEWNTQAVLAPRFSNVFRTDDPDASVGSVKPAESGDGVILRLWEPTGMGRRVTITFAFPVQTVEVCNALEEPHPSKDPPDILGETRISVDLAPFELLTLKVCPLLE